MSTTDQSSAPKPRWSDPNHCPFCADKLADPGAGFIDHLDENPQCASGFEQWRDRVAGDMMRGWGG